MEENRVILSTGIVNNKILLIRGQKVMLDQDLAELYEIKTKRLNEQVKRNKDRFPSDFMFQLTKQEFEILKSQNATSSWGGRRIAPHAFTEHGVLMLSSIIKSKRAVDVNIQIMRVFTKMREALLNQKDLILKAETIENQLGDQGQDIHILFEYMKEFIKDHEQKEDQKNRVRIGFKKEKQ